MVDCADGIMAYAAFLSRQQKPRAVKSGQRHVHFHPNMESGPGASTSGDLLLGRPGDVPKATNEDEADEDEDEISTVDVDYVTGDEDVTDDFREGGLAASSSQLQFPYDLVPYTVVETKNFFEAVATALKMGRTRWVDRVDENDTLCDKLSRWWASYKESGYDGDVVNGFDEEFLRFVTSISPMTYGDEETLRDALKPQVGVIDNIAHAGDSKFFVVLDGNDNIIVKNGIALMTIAELNK